MQQFEKNSKLEAPKSDLAGQFWQIESALISILDSPGIYRTQTCEKKK